MQESVSPFVQNIQPFMREKRYFIANLRGTFSFWLTDQLTKNTLQKYFRESKKIAFLIQFSLFNM